MSAVHNFTCPECGKEYKSSLFASCPECGAEKKAELKITQKYQPKRLADDPNINTDLIKSALNKQVAGNHYKNYKIQPIEFIHANNIGFIPGNIIKYACRYQDKNGTEDIDKIIHYCELLKELKDEE